MTGNEILARASAGGAVLGGLWLAQAYDPRWQWLAIGAGAAMLVDALVQGTRAIAAKMPREAPIWEIWSDLEPSGD